MRILQLPAALANQIAAGEVIERPASVVKELLENSKDAKASRIDIDIGFGGLNQIKISDNGEGIIAEDLHLAIAAHATSKIRCLDDLYTLSSMGFRGEALASIASISRLSIHSKPKDQACGMILEASGEFIKISPLARNVGTTVDVLDIFYSAPVRKGFLKSAELEFQALEMIVKRFSLSAPEIAISLTHNSKKILSLPEACDKASFEARVKKILGKRFLERAAYLDCEHNGLKIYGWLSLESYQRSQSDRIWVYINGRMIKDRLIFNAIRQAYEELLNPGRHPICLLYIVLDPKIVDVNVHPTKHEVRFQDARMVHDFITTELRKILTLQTPTQNIAANYRESLDLRVEYPAEPREQFFKLEFPFILFFIQSEPYLVNILKLDKLRIQEKLEMQSFPLIARPLLVPLSIEVSSSKSLEEMQGELAFMGIQIARCKTQERKLLVKSIPVVAENLDIKAFFNSYFSLSLARKEELIELVIANQSLKEPLLTNETYLSYLSYLSKLATSLASLEGIAKKLTKNLCRALLDA